MLAIDPITTHTRRVLSLSTSGSTRRIESVFSDDPRKSGRDSRGPSVRLAVRTTALYVVFLWPWDYSLSMGCVWCTHVLQGG